MDINQPESSKNSNKKQPSKKPSEEHSSESSKIYTNEPLDTARIPDDKTKQEGYSQKDRNNQRTQRETKIDDLYTYAKSNKEQTIAYILLALGLILLLLFNNLLGGLIIGMVAGYYFAPEIIHYLRNIGQVIGGQDQLRYVILTALLLAFFITAPGIFIGAIIVAVFRQVMQGPRNSSD